MNERFKMKTSDWLAALAFIVVLIIILMALITGVNGYEINANDTLLIQCMNCSVGAEEHINETISVTCLNNLTCENPEYNATCKINKSLLGGQMVVNTEGPCDINVSCQADKYGNFQDLEYPTYITVLKNGDEFRINIEVMNFKNESIYNWTTNIREEDVVEQKSRYSYICPHEVITEVNMQTCSEYLDPILGEQNPLIFALATGQNECTQQLIECNSEIEAERKVYLDWKDKFEDEQNLRVMYEEDLEECEFDLNNPVNGSCAKQVREVTDEYRDYKLATVPFQYFYATWIMALFIIIWVLYQVFSGESW